MSEATMPTIGVHRGVGIHGFQDAKRIEEIVLPAIDAVYAMTDAAELMRFAADHQQPPEARLFAGDKLRAAHELRAGAHERRTAVDLERLAAVLAGLGSLKWADPARYDTLLAPGEAPGEKRPARPPHQRERLLAAQEELRAVERAAYSK